MPRKRTYRTEQYPYHITARCTNKEWFQLPMKEVWNIFSIYLYFITVAYKVQIHSFVLMSNHFHMLITTPEANIDLAMNYLLREVSRRIGQRTNRINQIFGGPYHWTLIKNSIHYQHAYKYVYRNPVHAGICNRAEEYRYSSLNGLLGMSYLNIPVIDNVNLIYDTGRILKWLNEEYSDSHRESIRKALRHTEFQFERDPEDGYVHQLENRIV
jgi:REP element-mobilizing transposase RayT